MQQLVFQDGKSHLIQKKILTVGTELVHDVVVSAETNGLVFTVAQKADDAHELIPGNAKLKINGKPVSGSVRLRACDRIEWASGSSVYLSSGYVMEDGRRKNDALNPWVVLQNLSSTLQASNGLMPALNQALDFLVEASGAETGYLIAEMGSSGWETVVSRQGEGAALNSREVFSNTILEEAIRRRDTVYIENIIGHPWMEAASILEARIFSVACAPLCINDRVFGAFFLFSRSPGKSIRKEALNDLRLFATQAALMLASQSELLKARKENRRLQALLDGDTGIVWGRSEGVSQLKRKLEKIAPTPLSVLVLGETGTGKELIAREIHRLSDRAKHSFVAINCAAIPLTLLESTLFGHEAGAFTGAIRSQEGKFRQAHQGTLFLDEIGDLPLDLQAKLLRVLQEKQVEPLGSSKLHPVDVRILAATHRSLEKMLKSGAFRQDLYFRLNGATLQLPPLRERKEDVGLLVRRFLGNAGKSLSVSKDALEALSSHAWPGNVRELEQVITRAAWLSDGREISAKDLEFGQLGHALEEGREFSSLEEAQQRFTRDYVMGALKSRNGNRTEAAAALGISERTLYRILAAERSAIED